MSRMAELHFTLTAVASIIGWEASGWFLRWLHHEKRVTVPKGGRGETDG